MAIRPVDLQLLVQKTTEINRMDQGEARRPEVQHQQFSQVMQKQTEQETHQVLQTNKSEQDGIDKDGSNQNQYERRKKNKNKDKDELKTKSAKSGSTSMFDVTV